MSHPDTPYSRGELPYEQSIEEMDQFRTKKSHMTTLRASIETEEDNKLPYLNSDAIRTGLIPCETNPDTGALSRTLEPFHAKAEVTIGKNVTTRRHVCFECKVKHHRSATTEPGIQWG